MDLLARMLILFILTLSSAWADSLEIKVDNATVQLPYWPAREAHYGAVVLVRGGEDPQWSGLLARCARQLSDYGWSVVLLNCSQTSPVSWVKQLPEAIGALRQDANKRIVLIHYGDQLDQSLDYFSKPQSKQINGLIMLSAFGDAKSEANNYKLQFPLFDIAGQFDYAEVLTQMNLRSKEFKQNHYVSIEMPGAYHDYAYSQKMLLAFIHGWMLKLPESVHFAPPILSSYIEPISYVARISGA